ncbi:hypothetical protein [Streptomyces sp. NPDC101132]|uniref:hypothetical protein n=1 Tax=Streptomyces sp. NPDC101132 TaxID=3366110 RepID=UPI00380BDE8F
MTRTLTLGHTVFLTPAERLLHGRTVLDAVGRGGPEAWLKLNRDIGSGTDRRWQVSGRILVGFHWFDLHEPADWRTAPAPGPDGVIAFSTEPPGEAELCLALCHAEDRVREHALAYAADRPEVLPLVLIRSADPVGSVRERARALLAAAPDEAVRPLADLALLVGQQRHGGWAWELVVDRLGGVPAERIVWLTGHDDRAVRRAAVRSAVWYGLLPDWRAELLAADEPEAGFRRLAVLSGVLCADTLEHLAATDPEADVRRPALDLLLRQPVADVLPRLLRLAGTSGDKALRRRALDAVRAYAADAPLPSPEDLLASPALAVRLIGAEELLRAGRYAELEPLLTDRAAKLRAVGRRALRAGGGDPRAYYRELCAEAPTKAAVLGLTECADPADTALLWRLAGRADAPVRAAALAGLRRRRLGTPDRLVPLLADAGPGLADAVRSAVLAHGDALTEPEPGALPAPDRSRAAWRSALPLLDRRPVVVRRRVARALDGHRDPAVRAWARAELARRLRWDVHTGRDAALALVDGAPRGHVLELEDPAAWAALDIGTRYAAGCRPELFRARVETALCHPSGRVREEALARAAGDPGLLPLVAVRCADWAAPVRDAARRLLAEALRADPAGTLGVLTPVVVQLAGRVRGDWAVARFREALRAPEAAAVRAGLLAGADAETRRFTARVELELLREADPAGGAGTPAAGPFLPLPGSPTGPPCTAPGRPGDPAGPAGTPPRRPGAPPGLPGAAELARRAAGEDDAVVRALWADASLALMAAGGTDRAAVEALLGARSGYVRAAGVTALRGAGRAGEASGYLADRSAQVRACARWLLRQDGGDPRAAYLSRVAEGPVPEAVLGLAECGERADAPVLTGLLGHADGSVRAAAVAGLVVLDAAPPALLPALLDDPSPAVVREARRALYDRSGAVPEDALYERCRPEHAPHTRSAALRLLARQGAYDAVRIAVGLLEDPDADPGLRDTAGRVMRSWNWRATLRSYPSGEPELRQLALRYRRTLSADEASRRRNPLP